MQTEKAVVIIPAKEQEKKQLLQDVGKLKEVLEGMFYANMEILKIWGNIRRGEATICFLVSSEDFEMDAEQLYGLVLMVLEEFQMEELIDSSVEPKVYPYLR